MAGCEQYGELSEQVEPQANAAFAGAPRLRQPSPSRVDCALTAVYLRAKCLYALEKGHAGTVTHDYKRTATSIQTGPFNGGRSQ
jgi:hypothetical protein